MAESVHAECPALVIASRVPGNAPMGALWGSLGLHGRKYGSFWRPARCRGHRSGHGLTAGQQQGPHGQFGPQSQFVMAITSFLETQVRVRLAGGEGDFEGG